MNSNIELWLDHPITKTYIKILQEHKEAHLQRFLTCGLVSNENLPELAQIKGQINALDLMLDINQLEHLLSEEISLDE